MRTIEKNEMPPSLDRNSGASNQEDFAALYQQHAGQAYRLASKLTHDDAMAADAVQEAMLRVWRAAPSIHPGKARGWILRIVARECLRLRTAQQRELKRIHQSNRFREHATSDSFDDLRENALSTLRHAVATLSVAERHLLNLHYQDGLSQRRIGKVLSVPQQTVSYRIRHAIDRLRNKLERRSHYYVCG
jgi:RNA polymerase sigma-70 factor (ECF subfamily)